jgi:Putative lumazine-binding
MAGNYGTASAIAGGAFRPGVCEFDIAVVKVVDEWQCDRFTDYLTMLKHDGK